MKKYIIITLIGICTNALNINAYTTTLNNQSDGDVTVRVNYYAPGVCAEDVKVLKSGEQASFGVGICCARELYADAITGSAKGKRYVLNPPSCKSYTAVIKNTADRNLIVESYQ